MSAAAAGTGCIQVEAGPAVRPARAGSIAVLGAVHYVAMSCFFSP